MQFPKRAKLANLPTPIQKLERLSKEIGKNIYVWRDDLTGFVESGNKIRKLEFLAQEALEQGATRLITCGGPQSNHSRATAFVARLLGMEITIVVRKPKEASADEGPASGNLFLNQLVGADFRFVKYEDYEAAGSIYEPFLKQAAEEYSEKGEKPYVIPEGGSCALGSLGYMQGIGEMLDSWKRSGAESKCPDSLFTAVGSGGTHAGIYLGYVNNELPTESVYAVNVCDSREYFEKRVGGLIEDTVEKYGATRGDGKLNIFDGHFGEGYSLASDEDLRFYLDLVRKEGVLLDPVYTGKAFRGMLTEINRDPLRFGNDVLFLHSGGVFANFAFASRYSKLL